MSSSRPTSASSTPPPVSARWRLRGPDGEFEELTLSQLVQRYEDGSLSLRAEACAPGKTEFKPVLDHPPVIAKLNPEGSEARPKQPSFSDETVSLGAAEAMALSRGAVAAAATDDDEVTPASSARHEPPPPPSSDSASRALPSQRPLDSDFGEDEATRVVDSSPLAAALGVDDLGGDEEATRVFDSSPHVADDDEATRVFDGDAHQVDVKHAAPNGDEPPQVGHEEEEPTRLFDRDSEQSPPVPRQPSTPAARRSSEEFTALRSSAPPGRASRPPSPTQNAALGVFLFLVTCVVAAAGIYVFNRPLFERGLGWVRVQTGLAEAQGAATGPDFDTDAAAAVLTEAANRTGECKQDGGPTGRGRARILYQPTGTATSAAVSPPFHGTPTGQCLVDLFTDTQVPQFGGSPVIVTKTFDLD